MSYEESLASITLDADASVGVYTGVAGLPGSASNNGGLAYRFVKVTGAHTCGLSTASTDKTVGVLQNKPQGVGHAATVAIYGVSNVEAGAAVAAGAQVMSDSVGRGITYVAGTGVLSQGIALRAASAAGQLIPVLLRLG
jgi:hypothetical protein